MRCHRSYHDDTASSALQPHLLCSKLSTEERTHDLVISDILAKRLIAPAYIYIQDSHAFFPFVVKKSLVKNNASCGNTKTTLLLCLLKANTQYFALFGDLPMINLTEITYNLVEGTCKCLWVRDISPVNCQPLWLQIAH